MTFSVCFLFCLFDSPSGNYPTFLKLGGNDRVKSWGWGSSPGCTLSQGLVGWVGLGPCARFELLRADGCRQGSRALHFLEVPALWIFEQECPLGGSVNGDQILSPPPPCVGVTMTEEASAQAGVRVALPCSPGFRSKVKKLPEQLFLPLTTRG